MSENKKINGVFENDSLVGIDVTASGGEIERMLVMLFTAIPPEFRGDVLEFLNEVKDIGHNQKIMDMYYIKETGVPIKNLEKLRSLIDNILDMAKVEDEE